MNYFTVIPVDKLGIVLISVAYSVFLQSSMILVVGNEKCTPLLCGDGVHFFVLGEFDCYV